MAPDRLLDLLQIAFFFRRYERERFTRRLGARRATHPVDVIFRRHRDIEIDHMAEGFDINPARGDIGGHEHLIQAVLEASECQRALRLRTVAVNALGLDTVGHELRCETVGAMLGARENECLRHVTALEQLDQQGAFEILRDRIYRLRNADRGCRLSLQVERYRLAQHLLGESRDRGRHRGTEKQRLTFSGRQMTQDFFDLRKKSHVEHAIRFVEDEILERIQLCIWKTEVIEQPTWRCHHHIHTGAECMLLRTHAHTAKYGRTGERRMHRNIIQTFENLSREFTRWRDHECARDTSRLFEQLMHDRQQERVCLSAARHCARQHIAPLERGGNGLALNRRGTQESEILQTALETGIELQTGK